MHPSPSEVESKPETSKPSLAQLLDRPVVERVREWRYRFGQTMVFGLPVLALQIWGYSLSGNDAGRWVPIFQALLAGWVMYVAAAGVAFEGMLRLGRGKMTLDLLASLAALGMYLFSAASVCYIPFEGRTGYGPLLFHVAIIVMIIWCGLRWLVLSRRQTRG